MHRKFIAARKIFTGKPVYVTAVLAGNGPFLAKKHHTKRKRFITQRKQMIIL